MRWDLKRILSQAKRFANHQHRSIGASFDRASILAPLTFDHLTPFGPTCPQTPPNKIERCRLLATGVCQRTSSGTCIVIDCDANSGVMIRRPLLITIVLPAMSIPATTLK